MKTYEKVSPLMPIFDFINRNRGTSACKVYGKRNVARLPPQQRGMKTYGKVSLLMLIFIFSIHTVSATENYDIVIARGDLPVDLVVAQVYTQTEGIPLVTVEKINLGDELKEELLGYKLQGYKKVLIIGGESAVSKQVEDSILEMDYAVTRIWDWSRYGTAARVAVVLWKESDTVVIVQADTPGYLISGARIAMDFKSPLLLTDSDQLSMETKQSIETLGATRIITVGDIKEEVRNELQELGGVEQTKFSQLEIASKSSTQGTFTVGLIVGALFIFLLSSLWGGSAFLKKRQNKTSRYSVLKEDEEKVVSILRDYGGELLQSDLKKLTNFSNTKISRILGELDERDFIYKEKKGKNYVVKLDRKNNP